MKRIIKAGSFAETDEVCFGVFHKLKSEAGEKIILSLRKYGSYSRNRFPGNIKYTRQIMNKKIKSY